MKSHTRRHKLRELLVLTLLGVLMYVSQVIMAPLTNIELVSFLIIIVARKFGFKSLLSVYIFVFLEIFTYGLAEWVICYLYVWAILAVIVCLFRKIESPIFYTLLCSAFGFLFGTLCSPVSFIMGGFGYGISWLISGLRFDLLHGCGNFLLTFFLYKPIWAVAKKVL